MKGNCAKLERWNGTTWDLISKRASITSPELSRETVEEDLTLDCPGAGTGSATKKKSPGTKEYGDLEVELIFNFNGPVEFAAATETPLTNPENHHLFLKDFDKETATFWRIVHEDSDEPSGIMVHATVKTIGAAEYKPNETVKRTITLEPTGEFYKEGKAIEAMTVPAAPLAPKDQWGA